MVPVGSRRTCNPPPHSGDRVGDGSVVGGVVGVGVVGGEVVGGGNGAVMGGVVGVGVVGGRGGVVGGGGGCWGGRLGHTLVVHSESSACSASSAPSFKENSHSIAVAGDGVRLCQVAEWAKSNAVSLAVKDTKLTLGAVGHLARYSEAAFKSELHRMVCWADDVPGAVGVERIGREGPAQCLHKACWGGEFNRTSSTERGLGG